MKPVLQALLVADHVYIDSTTDKKIVAGIFHHIWFKRQVSKQAPSESPGEHLVLQIGPGGFQAGSPFCYVSLTDVHGQQEFELRYVDLANDEPIFGARFSVDGEDPLKTKEIVLALPRLPVHKAGNFALELLWNNEPLGAHRINVDEMPDEDNKDSK